MRLELTESYREIACNMSGTVRILPGSACRVQGGWRVSTFTLVLFLLSSEE
jgi:hypothetical protein